jgi:hypothetical protein
MFAKCQKRTSFHSTDDHRMRQMLKKKAQVASWAQSTVKFEINSGSLAICFYVCVDALSCRQSDFLGQCRKLPGLFGQRLELFA